jgi:hypothetical protein
MLTLIQGLPDDVALNPVVGELIKWRYQHYRRHSDAIQSWLDSKAIKSH